MDSRLIVDGHCGRAPYHEFQDRYPMAARSVIGANTATHPMGLFEAGLRVDDNTKSPPLSRGDSSDSAGAASGDCRPLTRVLLRLLLMPPTPPPLPGPSELAEAPVEPPTPPPPPSAPEPASASMGVADTNSPLCAPCEAALREGCG
jgi:hypothetical protein